MSLYDYDLFVIGAGSGGVRAARIAAGQGIKVAIAEDRYLGGTCVNVGCVPKKLFVYASHFKEDFGAAKGYGWNMAEPIFDWAHLMANKNKEIKRLQSIYQRLLENSNAHIINGKASLIDEHTIRINNTEVTAKRILVATGGWPFVPDIPGKEYIITSNEIFFLEQLPKRIVIVGGGYIAVEFAGILHGLGVETTLCYRGSQFLRGFDNDVRDFLVNEMSKKGINLIFNSEVKAIEKKEKELLVKLSDGNQLITNQILYAIGRKPNTQGLGLEEIGVKLDLEGAIIVNSDYQSTVPSIYALGDVTNRVNLTPVATAEAMALVNKLYGNKTSNVDYDYIPTAVFSQPTIGTVGLTETEAREQYSDIDIYKSSFKPMKNTLSGLDEMVFIKMIVVRSTDRVVGLHMVGAEAGEIIQGMAIAIRAGATKAVFDSTLGIHPTTAEEFVTLR